MVNGGPYAKLLPLKNGHYRRVVDPKIPYCVDDSTIYEEGSYSNDSTDYPNSVSGIFNTPVYNDYNKSDNKLEDYSYYHPTATFGNNKRTGLFTCCNGNADLYPDESHEDNSPPEVGLADSSSNYLSLKSRATPRDRGRGDGGNVASSGLPAADLREAEGEVNREGLHGEWKTSGGESDGRMDNKASCKLHIGGEDVVKCDMLLCNCCSNSNIRRLSSDKYERLGMVLDEGIMPMVLENDKKSIVDNSLTSKLSLIYKYTSDYFLKACKYICYVDEDYYNELFPGSILYTDKTSDFNVNPEEQEHLTRKNKGRQSLRTGILPGGTESVNPEEQTSTVTPAVSSPLEVQSNSSSTRRGASSNYLSLKSRTTPGDRGGREGSGWTSNGDGLPAADLREAKGEVNREGHHGEWMNGGDDRNVTLDGEATSVFYSVSGNGDSSLETKLSSISTIIHVSDGIVSSSPSFNDDGISAPKFKTSDEIRLEKFGLEVDYNMEDNIFKTVGVNVLFYTKSRIVPTLLYLSIDNNKNVIYLTKKNISRFFPIKLINKIIISKNIILNEFQEQINDDPLIKLDCMMAFNAANFTNSVAIQFTNPIIKDKFIANIRYLKSEINGDTLEPL